MGAKAVKKTPGLLDGRSSFVPCTEVDHCLQSPAHYHINLHSLAWFGGIWWPANTFILGRIHFLGHLCRQSANARHRLYIDI